jgi:hypothetical protein
MWRQKIDEGGERGMDTWEHFRPRHPADRYLVESWAGHGKSPGSFVGLAQGFSGIKAWSNLLRHEEKPRNYLYEFPESKELMARLNF